MRVIIAKFHGKMLDRLDIVARRKKAATEMPDVDVKALEAARELRLKEIQMEAILKEFLVYFFFVSVVFFLSYQTRDLSSHDYAQNIKNTFVETSPVHFQDGVCSVIKYTIYMYVYNNRLVLTSWYFYGSVSTPFLLYILT